ncbi:MAG: hypothetical protein Q8P50_01160 [Bacillota bacterium]|nr:hypothetical protein [Bacillota bacterium]
MCEFCHQHGEGKVWYLQIKNYLTDLLHSDLSAEHQEIIGARLGKSGSSVSCPSQAIQLFPRQEVPEAANLWLKNTPLSTIV